MDVVDIIDAGLAWKMVVVDWIVTIMTGLAGHVVGMDERASLLWHLNRLKVRHIEHQPQNRTWQ